MFLPTITATARTSTRYWLHCYRLLALLSIRHSSIPAHKLDPDVPSPAQFDHIIGYLPQGKDKEAVWLDTTSEVGPLAYLVPLLRDKPALVMSGDKSIQLVTTPADPPFPNTEAFKIDGKLSADGTLEAKLRTRFEAIPRSCYARRSARLRNRNGRT